MKTLVIHPFDPTTAFLSVIYSDKNWTVVTQNISKKQIKDLIKSHDRIVLLGHGSGIGLFGFGRIYVDSTFVYLLRKKETVCIWCNADVFVKKYGLKGFNTGMIISDFEEALMYSVKYSDNDIEISNSFFAESIKNAIDLTDMLKAVKESYTSDTNSIIMFNSKNLYYNG